MCQSLNVLWEQCAKHKGKQGKWEHEHEFSKYSLNAYIYHPKVKKLHSELQYTMQHNRQHLQASFLQSTYDIWGGQLQQSQFH